MKNQGFPPHMFDGRPVIGIANTFSEFNPCNAHFRKIAEHVKRGVYEAGGFPLEFPVFSNSESQLRPTAMLYRNLARSEEHTSELQSLMRLSYAVFCLKKKKKKIH